MIKKPLALIFDLDDTLIPSSLFYAEAVSYALNQNPKLLKFYEEARAAVKSDLPPLHTSARNRLLYFKRLLELCQDQRFSPLQLCDLYDKELSRLILEWSRSEKRLDLIKSLQSRYPSYILTNETTRAQLLKIEALCQHQKHGFHGILCSEEVGFEKPDFRIFQAFFKRFSLNPSQCLLIGDSLKNDILGARDVGLTSIQTIEFNPEKGGAKNTVIIHHLNELLEILP